MFFNKPTHVQRYLLNWACVRSSIWRSYKTLETVCFLYVHRVIHDTNCCNKQRAVFCLLSPRIWLFLPFTPLFNSHSAITVALHLQCSVNIFPLHPKFRNIFSVYLHVVEWKTKFGILWLCLDCGEHSARVKYEST